EDFLRTISAPNQLRKGAQPRPSGKTATQIRPGATQARPAPPVRGSPSRPTPVAQQPPSPMPRGSPSRPVPVQGSPSSPPRGSPSRPTPAVEPSRARALVEDDLHRAEQALSISLGPVARTLVKRAARNANTPWELFSALAAEVPEGPERERFLAAQPDY
ncbi:MAG TPA: hypothetical protein VFD38_14755, partial [Myxococcaceae bacterium]|nr:hypothetical protein [Myxococcaceae bacterium]